MSLKEPTCTKNIIRHPPFEQRSHQKPMLGKRRTLQILQDTTACLYSQRMRYWQKDCCWRASQEKSLLVVDVSELVLDVRFRFFTPTYFPFLSSRIYSAPADQPTYFKSQLASFSVYEELASYRLVKQALVRVFNEHQMK